VVRTWTLTRRITALVAVVAALLGAIAAAAAVTATANRDQVADLLDRIGPLRTDSASLLTVLVDQETGVRGYALSHNQNFLDPYRDGITEEHRLLADMRRLSRDPKVAALISAVDDESRTWRDRIAEPTITAAGGGATADALPALSPTAKTQFDRIRAAVAALQDRVAALRSIAAAKIQSDQNRLVTLLILAGAVVLVTGVGLVTLMRRLVSGPVVALAGEVRRVSQGEYTLEIGSHGPPEVARLADDVNAMRRQIVADLEVVRYARQSMEDVNRRLEQQAEELTRSNRDLEQFAYVASHDLQEPLRKVASFCQLLQRRYSGQLDERADQYIAFAVDGAQRMQRLINDLLAFSRIGRITSGFVDVDLERVMVEAASQLGWRPGQDDAAITWSPLPTVRGEEPLLSAMFTNLIGNSLKFRHPDRPPKVHVTAERVGDEWQISFADNGIGIEPAYADKIFVIFQRLHPKNEYPGTGIGLAITKKIIEYHGGRIWLDAGDREGTLFRLTIPAITDEQPAVPTGDAQNHTEPASSTIPDLIPAVADAPRVEETAR
jgi:signal transduction histidine kinase